MRISIDNSEFFKYGGPRHIFWSRAGRVIDFLPAQSIIPFVMDDAIKNELAGAIEKVVRDEFSDAAIDAVCVTPDFDIDGDPVLRVTVVLKSGARFDAKKAISLTRHLFPAIKKSGDASAFPVVSFRSQADHQRLCAAA